MVKYTISYVDINIEKYQLLVIYDDEMLQKVDLGIMMKHGHSDLIKVSTYMCDSNNENSVGKVILKYILK